MTTTRYFTEQVLRKRPYLTVQLCRSVLANPIRRIVQDDGRIRHWGQVILQSETETRILRVITLEDGQTLHNAFIDRNFREDTP
jgi:riboflavin biosynthesis pyrimidine reductase